MSVSIKIEGVRQTPRWETIDKLLREALVHPDGDKGGRLIRIARLDQRADYRSHGTYQLNFEYIRYATREVELVVLEVK